MRSGRLPVAARTCSARGPGCFAGHQFGPFVLLARSEEREQLGRVQTKSPGLLEQQLSGDVGVIAGPEPDHDIKMPRFTALVDQAAKNDQQSRSGQGQAKLFYPLSCWLRPWPFNAVATTRTQAMKDPGLGFHQSIHTGALLQGLRGS